MSAWPGVRELLCRVVQTPSVSGSEGPALDVVAEALAAAGHPSERVGRNLVARIGRAGDGPELWLNAHIDTVNAAEGYGFDPWCGTLTDDGRVLGLGANDAKASVAAMSEAFVRFSKRHPGFDGGRLALVISCDEETGGDGLELLLRELPNPDALVIGEPNDLQVTNCCKGLVRAHVDVSGTSAHASRPWTGDSAIRRAFPALERLLAGHGFPEDPVLGPATLEPTIIRGGHQANSLAESVRITLDARTTPAFDNGAMVAHLRALIDDLDGCELVIASERLDATRTPPDGRLVRAALRARGQAEPLPFPSVCDFVFAGHLDAVVMGPGQLERSHTVDEFVLVSEVEEGVDSYLATAEHFFEPCR